jgi:hypothetical protein
MKNQYSVSGFKSEMSTIQQQINNINNQQQQQQQLDDQQQQQQNMMQAVSMGQVIIFQQSGIEVGEGVHHAVNVMENFLY